jgi:hypothetical protein
MSSSVFAYVSLVEWHCGRCGELFDDNYDVHYSLEEGDRVPSASDMHLLPENGHTDHYNYGDICDDCYNLVENPDNENEPALNFSGQSHSDRLIAQREAINKHLENLVKIMEVQHG